MPSSRYNLLAKMIRKASISLLLAVWVSSLPVESYDFSASMASSHNGQSLPRPADLFNKQALPEIISRGETIRAAVGEKVTLPCQVRNLGTYVLVWQTNSDVLTAQSIMVIPDPRFRLTSKHNLQIHNIRSQDAGDYTCKISVMGDPITITHTLEILVPPSIRPDPANGRHTVKKGRKVELRCIASGNPDPTITWTRLNEFLPGEGSLTSKTLVIDSVDRHDAGTYICQAHNGVGSGNAEARIDLEVLYPPEIDLETERVHSGDNKEAHLTCIIHGNPEPKVRWYKNSMLLEPTDTIKMMSRPDNRHTLILSSIRSGLDFGNYSCVAENSLGTFKKHIEVHGRPTPAVFRSPPEVGGRSTYLLTWSVDSYSPIEEYRLLYRQIQPYHKITAEDSMRFHGSGDWTNVIIPGDPDSEGFNHRQSYDITNLNQDAEYECLVQARNRFGWSEASRIFHFFTGKREPNVRDMEWKTNSVARPTPTAALAAAAVALTAALSAF